MKKGCVEPRGMARPIERLIGVDDLDGSARMR